MISDLGLDVSRETSERLSTYEGLLKKWNPAINLVAKSTLEDAGRRHFLDSAQLFRLAPKGARHWADLGSGGGFPGLVVAILGAELAPEMRFTLVESDGRKSAFLATVGRECGLTALTILPERIEEVAPLRAGVLSARALAPLTKLLGFAERHLAPGGTALFPKGAQHSAEIAEARENWRFEVSSFPSKIDPHSTILQIEGLSRV